MGERLRKLRRRNYDDEEEEDVDDDHCEEEREAGKEVRIMIWLIVIVINQLTLRNAQKIAVFCLFFPVVI